MKSLFNPLVASPLFAALSFERWGLPKCVYLNAYLPNPLFVSNGKGSTKNCILSLIHSFNIY